jgi:outer membrane lipoprotein-sorting protein
MRNIKILLLLILVAAPVFASKITNGEQLVTAMHKKYAKKWYKTLTFVQKNTQYKPDGTTQNSIWYEAMSAPGKLRIDFDPLASGNGIMFADGMQHNFKDGKLAKSSPLVHPLMVLGFDVYMQPVEKTVSQLKELKIDLSTLHEEKLDGRDVYVVGAKQGDLRTAQFWVDKKNLYFVKMIEPVGKNLERVQEIQFNKYIQVKGGGWVSPEVVFLVDGKRVYMEEYSDIQTDVDLDAKLFDTQNWMTADRTYFKKK